MLLGKYGASLFYVKSVNDKLLYVNTAEEVENPEIDCEDGDLFRS